ncbi:hypothetical protein SRHO_G00163230 [Serrasalmus rhombeus]
MEFNYLKIIMIPIFICILSIILKACWKCCWSRATNNDEHLETPIYVIPIPINAVEDYSSDEDSVASVDPYAPPSYDSLDPPPLYSEQKLSIPDGPPPAYSQLEIPAGSANHFSLSSPSEPEQSFHYDD